MDAVERKNVHFTARAESIKARGGEVRTDALRREIADDLRILDRARSEGLLKEKKKAKKKFEPKYTTQGRQVARPELHAEALARRSGSTFYARAINDEPAATTPAERITGVDAERRNAMMARIALLSQRGPGRIKSNESMDKGSWLYPQFAREIAMTTIAFNAGLGGYKELRAGDRRRRFFRALEDICNRSNAAVGFGWWVKR